MLTADTAFPNFKLVQVVSGTGFINTPFQCTDLGTCSIDAMSDVSTLSASSGNFLKFNGSTWVPGTITQINVSSDSANSLSLGSDNLPYFAESLTILGSSGIYLTYLDESGVQTNIDINNLLSGCSLNSFGDVVISSLAENQILRWDGYNWINSNENPPTSLVMQPEESGNILATQGYIIPVNVASGAANVTPPAGIAGAEFAVVDSRANCFVNNITVNFSGSAEKLYSLTQNYILDEDGAYVTFRYVNATIGWVAEK